MAHLVTLDDLRDFASVDASGSSDAGEDETPVLQALADARVRGFDTVCLPLTNEHWKCRWRDMCILPPDCDPVHAKEAERRAEDWRSKPLFIREELTMTRLDEAAGAYVLVSDWLELDATDDWVRHDAETALRQELAYAAYLNISTVILPPPRNRTYTASYARAVSACLKISPYMQLSIRLPIYDPSVFGPRSLKGSESDPFDSASSSPIRGSASSRSSSVAMRPPRATEGELNATWEMWDAIRSICNYDARLSLTLDMTPPLPATLGVLKKWTAESVRNIFLPASAFIANAKGYPVLPKATQSFLRDCMSHRPTVILGGTRSGLHKLGGAQAYFQYVRHLEKTSPSIQATQQVGTVENFAQGYQDYLQAPLQPLMDNLQSVTYETFEKDPVKYRNYEEAVYRALVEWPREGRIVICVAGAGRGPLVSRCLTAIGRARKDAFIHVVEKNPSAFVTLQGRQTEEWGPKVNLVFGDMRHVEVPEMADILVSELLGSFGDNELSPECLDGAMHMLKPDGISIPSSYTAHLAPLSSAKLYKEAHMSTDSKAVETPYVVMFEAVNILSGDGGGLAGRCGPQVQECWEFEHPRRDALVNGTGLPFTNSHNTRSATLTFHIPHAGVLHGLAGYFEAVLYGDIGLSIHPHRKDQISKDMLSWFPLFFPLKDPLYLPSNSELQVSIWRLTSQRQVWYEWFAEAFLPVYNSPTPAEDKRGSSPPIANQAPFFAHMSTPVAAPSPIIDAADSPMMFVDYPREAVVQKAGDVARSDMGVVKIGQTSLHNPGGRSSWIGL